MISGPRRLGVNWELQKEVGWLEKAWRRSSQCDGRAGATDSATKCRTR